MDRSLLLSLSLRSRQLVERSLLLSLLLRSRQSMNRSLLLSLSLRSRQFVDQSLLLSLSLRSRFLFDRSFLDSPSLRSRQFFDNSSFLFWPQMTGSKFENLWWPRKPLFLNHGIKSFILVYNLSWFANIWILTPNDPKYLGSAQVLRGQKVKF